MKSTTVGISICYTPLDQSTKDKETHRMPDGTHVPVISMDIDWAPHRIIPRIGETIRFGKDFNVLITDIAHELPTHADDIEDLYIHIIGTFRYPHRGAWTNKQIQKLRERISTYPNVTLTGREMRTGIVNASQLTANNSWLPSDHLQADQTQYPPAELTTQRDTAAQDPHHVGSFTFTPDMARAALAATNLDNHRDIPLTVLNSLTYAMEEGTWQTDPHSPITFSTLDMQVLDGVVRLMAVAKSNTTQTFPVRFLKPGDLDPRSPA